jgi:3-hydroxyisobutyrate dehydrogenase
VVGDLVVDAEQDGLGLAGQVGPAQRAADALDPDPRRVRDVTHARILRPTGYPRRVARVAFIGLGTMGRPMAGHLVEAGHEVVACDADPARSAALRTATTQTPAEAVAGADVAILSLPAPATVEHVVLGAQGLRAELRPGMTVIDMSTSPPALARRLAAELETVGADFLDAPVSGGPAGAEAGTLAIMVGGKAEAFARCRPLFEAMGSLVEHVGGHGAGQAVKLCNNLIVGCTMAAMAEACAVLEHEGIDPRQVYKVFTRSTSDSSVLRRRFPLPGVEPGHPASRGYEALFRLDLLVKDLGLALELAAEHGVETKVGEAAARAYEAALAAGLGALDYSAVYLATAQR